MGLGFLQGLDGVADVRIQSRAAGIKMRQDRGAHPRVPEFTDVFGDPRDGLVMPLALKEFADLVGHVDQPVRRHGWLLRRRVGQLLPP